VLARNAGCASTERAAAGRWTDPEAMVPRKRIGRRVSYRPVSVPPVKVSNSCSA